MPSPQITNPLGAFVSSTQGVVPWSVGQSVVEVQNNSTGDITQGMAVVATVASSSFYPAAYTVKATTDVSQGIQVLGIALETIQAVQPTTQTTGVVENVAPRFATGTVAVAGVVWAALNAAPGANFALPNIITVASTGNAGIGGSSVIRGICTATSTSVGVGIGTTSIGIGSVIGIAVAGSSNSITNSSVITGSSFQLFPIQLMHS